LGAARAAGRACARARHPGRIRFDRARQRPGECALPRRRGSDGGGERPLDIHVRGRLTTLRPAGAGDVERLVAWHADPEVSRYWDDETFTVAEMEERFARDDVEAWIVEESGEAVRQL